jgi:hypothetical protein
MFQPFGSPGAKQNSSLMSGREQVQVTRFICCLCHGFRSLPDTASWPTAVRIIVTVGGHYHARGAPFRNRRAQKQIH